MQLLLDTKQEPQITDKIFVMPDRNMQDSNFININQNSAKLINTHLIPTGYTL